MKNETKGDEEKEMIETRMNNHFKQILINKLDLK